MEHHFNTEIAKIYGIEEAIVLHHFYFWIAKNACNETNFFDGLYWTYNSRESYAKFFGYINETKIYRVLKLFVDEGILKKGDYNKDRWKRPNWYALTEKGLKFLQDKGYDMTPFEGVLQNGDNDCVKMNNGVHQNEQPLLINNTDKNTDGVKKEEKDTKVSKEKEDAFVERMYKIYPSKCPMRKISLGKSYKDKDRIRKLLKHYSMEDIEGVIKREVEDKYGKHYMQNFSTFLNNFPDPKSLFTQGEEKQESNDNIFPQGYWQ